jgi:hypothetical protein
MTNVLEEADDLIHGIKREEYGPAKESAEGAAAIWNEILKSKLSSPITAEDFCLCMIGVKLVREAARRKRDNLVDIAGYAGLAELCEVGS